VRAKSSGATFLVAVATTAVRFLGMRIFGGLLLGRGVAVPVVGRGVGTLGGLGRLGRAVGRSWLSRLTALSGLVPIVATAALWGGRVCRWRVDGNTTRFFLVPVPGSGRARLAAIKEGVSQMPAEDN
jgi:hypothetical protein